MSTPITEELAEVRVRVRALVDEWGDAGRFTPACDSWLRRYDLAFSKALGERGLLGISWPREYGGSERSGLARLVVTEELLRAGAPVAAHWIADRQIGPSILKHGTEAVKQAYLPGIARGELTFCLGMSETESGSDLASVRTIATQAEGGWRITGRKIWTSQAHRSTHAYVLARTSTGENKHDGLTEFVVDMADPGVEVRPIFDLSGEHHFNEVIFDDVYVADDHVLGLVGQGWSQVTEQLSLERGGVERVMSTYPLLDATIDNLASRHEGVDSAPTGEVLARLAALRAMAFDVAWAIDAGRAPIHEAAMLKDLGTGFEREVNEYAREQLETEADPLSDGPAGLLAQGVLAAPGFTIRGGTTEVLRTVVARGVPSRLRGLAGRGEELVELRKVIDDVLDGLGGDPGDGLPDAWGVAVGLGWPRVGVDAAHGGEDGDIGHVAELVAGLGRHGVSLPLAETVVAARALAAAGLRVPGAERVLAVATGQVLAEQDDVGFVLRGRLVRVPWGRLADEVLVAATDGDRDVFVRVPGEMLAGRWVRGTNLAAEPRDSVDLEDLRLPNDAVVGADLRTAASELSLLRAVGVVGALERALVRTVEHVTARVQFGKPLVAFQAVAGLLAVLASEHETARLSAQRAVAAVRRGDSDAWTRVAAARVVCGRSGTEGARIAHQLHAAMGVTREHPLHLATRRIWSWRDESGTQRSWAAALGDWALKVDGEQRWRWVTEQNQEAGQ